MDKVSWQSCRGKELEIFIKSSPDSLNKGKTLSCYIGRLNGQEYSITWGNNDAAIAQKFLNMRAVEYDSKKAAEPIYNTFKPVSKKNAKTRQVSAIKQIFNTLRELEKVNNRTGEKELKGKKLAEVANRLSNKREREDKMDDRLYGIYGVL